MGGGGGVVTVNGKEVRRGFGSGGGPPNPEVSWVDGTLPVSNCISLLPLRLNLSSLCVLYY